MNGGVADTLLLFNTTPRPNLNSGQDTRANRTRHTTRSSTQPHAHTHLPIGLPIGETENDANQQTTRPASAIAATLPQPPPRASAFAMGTSALVLISARSFYNVDEKFEQFYM